MISSKFWKNKKVLITGNTGFKGSWLSLWLIQMGAKVTGIGLPPNTTPSLFEKLDLSSKIENCFFNDIRDQLKLRQIICKTEPDVVFHLAAQPLVRDSYNDPLGTWSTNLIGSLNILDSLSEINKRCSLIMITTDKVYKNKEWGYGYRENDELGGHDPYSASKAACEIAIESWRASFCNSNKSFYSSNLAIATARSGNVIGGGDWSKDRILPDVIRALKDRKKILVRNPNSTRPWQHVLEPLCGYLILAEKLYKSQECSDFRKINKLSTSFNFGPNLESNRSVSEIVEEILNYWPGEWEIYDDKMNLHEAKLLYLNIDRAYNFLNWEPKWDFNISVRNTINWYKKFYHDETSALSLCIRDLEDFINHKNVQIINN